MHTSTPHTQITSVQISPQTDNVLIALLSILKSPANLTLTMSLVLLHFS